MSSFFNNDRAIVEPHADMPAMALAVVGFIVFIAVLSQAYGAFQDRAFIAENYQDAANLAEKLSRDAALTGSSRPDVIDAAKLEGLGNDPQELVQKYGAHYNFVLKVEVNTMSRIYTKIIKDPDISGSKYGVSSSIPVTVRFNEAQELPGTLTVKIWRK